MSTPPPPQQQKQKKKKKEKRKEKKKVTKEFIQLILYSYFITFTEAIVLMIIDLRNDGVLRICVSLNCLKSVTNKVLLIMHRAICLSSQ